MDQLKKLEQTIQILEQNRATLTDDVVNTAIEAIHREMAILETEKATHEQRRLVSILFVDVVSSTKTFEKLDPEDVLSIMNKTLRVFGQSVERHGGFVARLFGDALLAFFGAPISHEDDAERAVRAGLDILEDASREAAGITENYDVDAFNVRVGINTGLVALGEVGGAGMEYTAMGDAINVAKHVEAAAPSGRLLISHDTYRHVRGVFDVDEAQQMQFKGRENLTRTYIVNYAKPRGFHMADRIVEGIETLMVGRDKELETLKNCYLGATSQNKTHLATITGPAGVGKSRLLTEFDMWVETLPGAVRYFNASATTESVNVPFGLFQQAFINYFDIHDTDSTPVMQSKIEAGISEMLDVRRAHIIGELLGLDFKNSPHIQEVEQAGLNLYEIGLRAMADFFAESTRRPIMSDEAGLQHTVLFLEDLQWADESSLELVQYMIETCSSIPLLIVGIARPQFYETHPDWGEGILAYMRIELHPLSTEASEQLITHILQKVNNPPESLIELVLRNADGNPFYIEEMIKMCIEEGVIVKGEENWWVESGRLEALKVPPTLTGLVQARLDKLPASEREVLQKAAVAGNTFWDDLLKHMSLDEDIDLGLPPEYITDLQQHGLIIPHTLSAFDGTNEYLFKSAILREVVYDSVLRRRRNAYHIQVANWLRQHSKDRRSEYSALIAEHYVLGGKKDDAIQFLLEAASLALHVGDLRVALRDFERILQLLPETGHEEQRVAIEIQLGSIYLEMGNLKMAESWLQKSLVIARHLSNPRQITQLLNQIGEVATKSGNYEKASTCFQEALPLAHETGDTSIIANTLMRLGTLYKHQGEYDKAIEYFQDCLNRLQGTNKLALQSRVLRKLAIAARLQGNYGVSQKSLEESLEICNEIGNEWARSNVFNSLGELARVQQQYEKARRYYEEGLGIAENIANQQLVAIINLNLGHTARAVKKVAEAQSFYRLSLRQSRKLSIRPLKLNAVAGLAGLKSRADETETALSWLYMVVNHPACNSRVRHTADPLINALELQTDSATIARTKQIAKTLVLEELVAQELEKADPARETVVLSPIPFDQA